MTVEFTSKEREAMKDARLALFHGAIILDAQPPISRFKLWRLGRQSNGSLPSGLVELWRTAFGGTLDYDLRATFGTQVACLSFRQLFFPGSDAYFDLDGWIAHERGINDGKKLDAMPFGGFESDERLYALTCPGEDQGTVVAFTEGLDWAGYVNSSSLAKLAPDVPSLFRMLWLETDPKTLPEGSAEGGRETLTRLNALAAQGAHGHSAADKLKALQRARILDWRAALENGSLKQHEILTKLALEFVAAHDDLLLLQRLDAQRINTLTPLRGSGTVFELAARHGSLKVVNALLDRHPVRDVLRFGAQRLPVALVERFLAAGALADASVLYASLSDGEEETALSLLQHCEVDRSVELAVRARKRANTARSEGRPAAADQFDAFADRVDPSLYIK